MNVIDVLYVPILEKVVSSLLALETEMSCPLVQVQGQQTGFDTHTHTHTHTLEEDKQSGGAANSSASLSSSFSSASSLLSAASNGSSLNLSAAFSVQRQTKNDILKIYLTYLKVRTFFTHVLLVFHCSFQLV